MLNSVNKLDSRYVALLIIISYILVGLMCAPIKDLYRYDRLPIFTLYSMWLISMFIILRRGWKSFKWVLPLIPVGAFVLYIIIDQISNCLPEQGFCFR